MMSVLMVLSVGGLIVQVATNRDVNDVQARTAVIQTKVLGFCLNNRTLDLCERQVGAARRKAVVQLCEVVADRLDQALVRCFPQNHRKDRPKP